MRAILVLDDLRFELVPGAPLVLGRGNACDFRVPDTTLARQHCRFTFVDGAWWMEDLKTAGGTSVNRVRQTRAALRPGDVLHLGRLTARFEAKTDAG